MSNWSPILSEHLATLGNCYKPDELAYLALTQKAEHTIRDKLAFSLHQSPDETRGLVCREWERTDLAVVDKDKALPLLLLEAKAAYTFDIANEEDYPQWLIDDRDKALALKLKYKSPDTDVFTLLLATHPDKAPDRQYYQAVKYAGRIQTCALRSYTIEHAKAEVARRLSGHPLAAHGVIDAGTAFGVPVSILYWLFGPYPKSS